MFARNGHEPRLNHFPVKRPERTFIYLNFILDKATFVNVCTKQSKPLWENCLVWAGAVLLTSSLYIMCISAVFIFNFVFSYQAVKLYIHIYLYIHTLIIFKYTLSLK